MNIQNQFFDVALEAKALCFGHYTLKSGRISPYFFNAGKLSSGKHLDLLAECYAKTIYAQKLSFDVLFGPAYKGIPLGALVAAKLYHLYGIEVGFAYNRKEKKDHGEGGVLVGSEMCAKRVLIIDDVITAGTAINESLVLLKAAQAQIVGVIVALDRQEKAPDSEYSAIQMVERSQGVSVYAIANLHQLMAYVQHTIDAGIYREIEAYAKEYGISQSHSK